MQGAWCILRTSGRHTLTLPPSLAMDQIHAWTPALLVNQRLPRTRACRVHSIPILPTFVFARADHISELARLETDPASRHDQFSIFRHYGRIPLLGDADLEPLRSEEMRTLPKERRVSYGAGQSVRVPDGSFGGMSGIVEGEDGRHTLVCFGGSMRVKIATFLLRPDAVHTFSSAA